MNISTVALFLDVSALQSSSVIAGHADGSVIALICM